MKTAREDSKPSRKRFFARIGDMNRLFLLAVVLPTFISAIYFGLIASDVYVSESRFIVRTPDRQATASPLSALLSTDTSFAHATADSYTAQNFILSRDALKLLNEKFDIAKAFSSPNGDILNRFPGLDWWNNSFEDFSLYYQNKVVSLQVDSVSSISTLVVRAFSAEDAFRINQQLLEISETLINQLNERGRQDMIRFAMIEKASAEQVAKAAALALSIYRDQKVIINPEQQSTIQLQQIAKLQDELVTTQAQLTQLQTFTTNNPQIPSLQQRVQNLRQEIVTATQQVAGGKRSLANKAAEYEQLIVERDYADKQLTSAMASLEQARNEAQRQQLYLERIVQPGKPDKAMEPLRIRGIFITFMLGLIAWGILAMLIAGIKEHRD